MATTRGTDPRPESAEASAPPPEQRPVTPTLLVDAPPSVTRSSLDLAAAGLALLGVGLVLALAALTPGTAPTLAVDAGSTGVWHALLTAPLAAVEGVTTFALPAAVLLQQWVRAGWRSAVRALVVAAVASAAALGTGALAGALLPDLIVTGNLFTGGTLTTAEGHTVVFNPFIAGACALLTAAASRHRSRLLTLCWWLLGAVIVLTVLRGQMSLSSAAVMGLVGLAVGRAARWVDGSGRDVVRGPALVSAIRTAGVDAAWVVRADGVDDAALTAVRVVVPTAVGYTEAVRERPRPLRVPDEDVDLGDAPAGDAHRRLAADLPGPPPRATESVEPAPDVDAAARAARARKAVGVPTTAAVRRYLVEDTSGDLHEVEVLDAAAARANLWQDTVRRLVRPGVVRRPATSLDAAVDRATLVTLAARQAGVRVSAVTGSALTSGSAVLVLEHRPGTLSLASLAVEDPAALTDDVLDGMWVQVRRAHRAGIAHLDLCADSVTVDASGEVGIRDWHEGETASTELSRRVDLAQALTLQATVVGVERALASATRALDPQTLSATAPLLQTPALPAATREALDKPSRLLTELRDGVVAELPEADVEPVQLTRFTWRSVFLAVVLVAILWALVTSLDVEAVTTAVRSADPRWILAIAAAGATTYVGGGITLAAFSPGRRVRVGTAAAVQLAARVVGFAAPAGIGPAAVNLRYLLRRGLSMPVTVATVALVQLNQFVVTVLALGVVAALTGRFGTFGAPGPGMLWASGVLAVATILVLVVPPLRRRVWSVTGPTLIRAWGRLTWLAAHPMRLLAGVAGALLMSVGNIAAFGFSLAAFGYSLQLAQLALTYLVSTTVGSLIPTPGGIGPVEAAMTGGLTLAGVPASIAVSAAVLFRLVTFWGPVPFGWLALRRLQRTGVL